MKHQLTGIEHPVSISMKVLMRVHSEKAKNRSQYFSQKQQSPQVQRSSSYTSLKSKLGTFLFDLS